MLAAKTQKPGANGQEPVFSTSALGFREVIDYRRAVVRVVAPSGDPANQIIPIGRRERQNLYELHVAAIHCSPRNFHTMLDAPGSILW